MNMTEYTLIKIENIRADLKVGLYEGSLSARRNV